MARMTRSEAKRKRLERSETRVSSLTAMYQDGLTTRQIASQTGISARTVSRWLGQAGVQMRKPGQSLRHLPLNDPDWLRDQYWTLNKSCLVIAKEIGCEQNRVYLAMQRHGIRIRRTNVGRTFPEIGPKIAARLRGRFAGKENPNWRGGVASADQIERGSPKYQEWAKRVKVRDGYTCRDCGKRGGKLHAHHIQSWRKYPELRYELHNGLTLCPDCHLKAHDYCFAYPKAKTPRAQDALLGR